MPHFCHSLKVEYSLFYHRVFTILEKVQVRAATGNAKFLPLSDWFKLGSPRKITGVYFCASAIGVKESPKVQGCCTAELVMEVML